MRYKSIKILTCTKEDIKLIQEHFLEKDGLYVPQSRLIHIAVSGFVKKLMQKNTTPENDTK